MDLDFEAHGGLLERRIEQGGPRSPALRRRREHRLAVRYDIHGIAEGMETHHHAGNTLGSCRRNNSTRTHSDTTETAGDASAIPATPSQRENATSRMTSVIRAAVPIQTSNRFAESAEVS